MPKNTRDREGGCSSVGRALGLACCRCRFNSMVLQCKGFFSESQLSVQTRTWSFVQLMHAIVPVCAHVKNPKHWQPYHCLNTRKCSIHQVSLRRQNRAAKVARELKTVTYEFRLQRNGWITPIPKRKAGEEEEESLQLDDICMWLYVNTHCTPITPVWLLLNTSCIRVSE